jgi:hypothetical protein
MRKAQVKKGARDLLGALSRMGRDVLRSVAAGHPGVMEIVARLFPGSEFFAQT